MPDFVYSFKSGVYFVGGFLGNYVNGSAECVYFLS